MFCNEEERTEISTFHFTALSLRYHDRTETNQILLVNIQYKHQGKTITFLHSVNHDYFRIPIGALNKYIHSFTVSR